MGTGARDVGWILLLALALAGGCVDGPLAFEDLDLAEATRRVASAEARAVEVVLESTRRPPRVDHPRWVIELGRTGAPLELPEELLAGLAEGPVLLISDRRELAELAAATLLRARSRAVAVFVSENAADRKRLYALSRAISEEPPHGRDS